jgi:hypothetical protein
MGDDLRLLVWCLASCLLGYLAGRSDEAERQRVERERRG